MTDIARACGVSQATVSLVLSQAPGTRVSAATREAVRAKAEALGLRIIDADQFRLLLEHGPAGLPDAAPVADAPTADAPADAAAEVAPGLDTE